MDSKCIGWLLHVSIEQDKAVLWIKTEDKKILRLVDSYQPFFYILPRDEYDGAYLFHILSQQASVKKVKWEENKFTDLFEKYSKRKLICVFPESIYSYSTLLEKLENDSRVKQVFNNDLSHVQHYLFHKLKIEPTSRVEVDYNVSELVKLVKVEDEDDILPPPFSILHITIKTLSGKVSPEDPVMVIKSRHKYVNETHKISEVSFNSKEEKDILEAFYSYVQVEDPDILVFEGNHYANTILDYLFARLERHGLNLHLGRERTKVASASVSIKHPRRSWIKGRLALSSKVVGKYSSTLDKFGLAGLVELCRFGFLPLDLSAKYGMNRLIDSRNCYELIQRGYVIPKRRPNYHEHIRTIEELVSNDRGGMIISPKTGLHENVIVLDYDNEYANLIVNHNISYETIISNNKVKTGETNKGLLPTVVEKFLQRRLYLEETSKGLSEESQEYFWSQQRLDSLKNILVCLYGTTGSIWNRYSNVQVFEEINRLSREVLIKTKDIVQELGHELIYADTDSVFIKIPNGRTTADQYEKLVSILHRETSLPISMEHDFKYLVLLPLEADEKIEALKQYYGITHGGQLVVRGIELRRHDTPKFMKEFQAELLSTLFDCENIKDILNKGYENALLLVTKTIDKIMLAEENINQKDLVISKLLGQDIIKYKSLFPHVSAAIQLSDDNGHPSKGDTIKYIYTNSQHKNPLCRVVPIHSAEINSVRPEYDKEKYKEILLDAAETVLGYFGFDRTAYGNGKNVRARKWRWLQELKQEEQRDIKAETAVS